MIKYPSNRLNLESVLGNQIKDLLNSYTPCN